MEIQRLLKEVGLHDSEVRVYLYLLENGLSTPPQIAKGTGMARTNGYAVLQELRQKGLIEEQMKGKRKIYIATDPIALEQSLERKRQAIHQLLPDLRALYSAEKNRPKIQFFEGWDQVKRIFDMTLSAKEVFGIASTNKLFALDSSFFVNYRIQIKQKNIVFRDILTHASGAAAGPQAENEAKGFYSFRTLPSDYDDLPTDILIWNDQIALISTATPIFGTVLTNKALAQTFRMMFDVMWRRL
jgi:sugar-specific transcriptional regulator TrmB